jgi:hypothetical protein
VGQLAIMGRRRSKIVICETVAFMQRVRALALVAVLAGLLLSGCQAQPSNQAASVGDVTITDAQVDAVAAAYENAEASQPDRPPFGNGERAFLRQFVVQASVFNELARRYAAEKGLPAPTVDYAATAQRLGVPADNPFTKIVADSDAYRQMLLSRSAAGQPTDEDMRDAYDRYVKAATNAAVEPVPYEDIRNELVQTPEFAQGVGLRNELADAAERYGVEVSPRYQPLESPIWAPSQSQLVLVGLPLGESGDAVRDLG